MDTFQDNENRDTATLVEYCLDLPLAFAVWQDQGDEVLISVKMQSLLKMSSSVVSSIGFVKGISSIFGNFLYDAVEKVSIAQFTNRKYSTDIRTKYNKTYNVSLRYNIRTRIYIFTVVDIDTSSDNDKLNTEYSLLKVKNNVLNEILDSIPMFIWYKNKNSKLLYCNKEYATIQNTTVSEAICNNKHLVKSSGLLAQPNSVQQFNTNIKIHNETKKLQVTEFVSTVNNNYIIGIARDYIDTKTIDEMATSYKRYLSQTIDSMQDGVALFGVDNKLLCYNNIVLRLFNFVASDVDNKTFIEIVNLIISQEILANSSKDYRNSLLEAIKNIKNDTVVKVIQLINGKTVRVAITVNQDKTMLFVLTDITSNLARKREIRSIRTIYQSILNNIGDGTIIFGSDNRIKFANFAMNNVLKSENETNTNYLLEDNHIRDCFKQINFENEEEQTKFISDILNFSEQRTSFSQVTKFAGKTLECTYLPLPDGLNLLKFRDLSHFKSMEMDLKAASDKVSQITNLKSALITTIADEYIAPLSTITSLVEILDNKYFGDLTTKQEEYCKSIIKTAGYLKDISEAITYIALIKTDQMNFTFTEIDINEFIQMGIEEFSKNINKKISFTPIQPSLTVYIDTEAIKKALYHIIQKASYMMDENGTVSICVKKSSNDGNFFEIEISDDGNGIAEADLRNYQQYFVKDADIGELKTIDIGYALAHFIIQKHNGKLTIESEEEKGTTVRIQLQIRQFLV